MNRFTARATRKTFHAVKLPYLIPTLLIAFGESLV